MEVKTSTWQRDIHDIYDYETKEVVLQTLNISEEATYLARAGQHLEVQPQLKDKPLVGVYKKDNEYYVSFDTCTIDSNDNIQPAQPGYIIVRYLRNPDKSSRGYKLRVGDMFRLGQINFKVMEASCPQFKLSLKEKYLNATRAETDPDADCRICFEQSNSDANPLLRVCRCKGSMSYIHYECLRKCVTPKIKQLIKPNVQSYRWKNLNCDICMNPFQLKLNQNGEIRSLVNFPRPEGSYIVVQAESENYRGIHILRLSPNEKLLIGRGQDADLVINNTTISRQHAYLILDEQGYIRLHDSQSRFGTLVQINGPVKLHSTAFVCQVGSTVLGFRLKNN